jgi:pimeloyl-ACP methyl ester carboxylesterase
MNRIKPHVRSMGHAGPLVILLHASSSNARQWNTLAQALQSRYRVYAVDLYGHGGTPAWQGARSMRLEDEAALIEPLIAAEPGGVHLVGHSYGGAVALKLAVMHRQRVHSVAVYEPVMFQLLINDNARHRGTRQALVLGAMTQRQLRLGFADRAAQRFIDFWAGAGSWQAMAPERQRAIAAQVPAVVAQFQAVFLDDLAREHLSRLELPALCLSGSKTRACTRRVRELLSLAMPQARHELLSGLGHMGPVTHAAAVAQRLSQFLDAQAAPIGDKRNHDATSWKRF